MPAARAHRVSTRVRRTSPRQGPRAPTALVERMVMTASLVVAAYTDRLMRALEPLLQERYGLKRDSVTRQDRIELGEIFEQVREGQVSKQFLERMFHLVDNQAANDLQRVVPVPLADVLPDAARMQDAWVEKNVSLIRLEERARAEVRAIVEAPITEGVRVEEIRARIQERMGVVRSRAELIARDQTLKVYGQIQEARQQDAGIEEYTWSTSDDERVRHRHAELEGTTQRWDSPPVVDPRTGRREHPGGDFQCRCAAIPILPTGDLPPESETRPSRAPPANDVTLPPEEQAMAGPLPPDPVAVERERLAVERAAREAEAERRRAAERERLRLEAEAEQRRQRLEAQRAETQRAAEAERLRRAAAREELQRQAARKAEARAHLEVLRQARAAAAPLLSTAGEVSAEAEAAVLRGFQRAPTAPGTPARFLVAESRAHDRILSQEAKGVGGYYDAQAGLVVINADPEVNRGFYRAFDLAHPDWNIGPHDRRVPANTQNVARSLNEVIEMSTVHEYGHHIQMRPALEAVRATGEMDAPSRLIIEEFARPERQDVSKYARKDYREWWAESLTAYLYYPKVWLDSHVPRAMAFVEKILKMKGLR